MPERAVRGASALRGRRSPLGAGLALALALSACGGAATAPAGSGAAATSPSATSPSAGTPGASTEAGAEHNDADVRFAQDMIVHHRGALLMADLARERAQAAGVRALADRIAAAQEPEIATMSSWLEAWGEDVPEPAEEGSGDPAHGEGSGDSAHGEGSGDPAHGEGSGDSAHGEGSGDPAHGEGSGDPAHGASGAVHGGGMDSGASMAELQAAPAGEFDAAFLELMTEHHEGAVAMAEREQSEGQHPDALALAGQIAVVQTGEIEEMQALLASV